MTAACLMAPDALASRPGWTDSGPLLLFFGLLTLVNAPFDWAALGPTRGLLRRGIEIGGWAPWGLAVVDVVVAVALIAVLTGVTVEAVQGFDGMAVRGGGTAVLPLADLLDDMAVHPAAARHWWVYALLLSTLIPSLINLTIGGASLFCGLPGLPRSLLAGMPADRAPKPHDRVVLAAMLALQWPLGLVFATVALAGGGWLVFGYLMPLVGWNLLDLARRLLW